MTTLLQDGNDSVFSTSHIIDFDPADFGLPPDKQQHKSFDGREIHPRSQVDAINASYDETSASTASTRSDTSGASAPVHANARTRQTSMASLTNGAPMQHAFAVGKTELENGEFTLVDRTVRSTTVLSDRTATAEDDDVPPEPTAAPPPLPPSSLPPAPPSQPSHNAQEPTLDDTIQPPEPVGSPPPPPPTSLPPPPPTNAPLPTTPTSPSQSQSLDAPRQAPPDSPHRVSPPYSLPSTSTPALATPHLAGHAQLRQRHALEVPKKQPRGSRDSADAAFTSGRFSPTTPGPTATGSTRRASLSLGRRNTRSMQSDLPRDEVAPDEDAMRWAEAYRQKRASKKRRREEEDDDRVLVGTKVDEHHANWVTAYNMLTGIRVSVSRTNAKLDRDVTDADFDVKQKSTFDIAGNELVPSAKYDFKFKDYAPWVFRRLRNLFRLDPADYLMSLTGKYILSELGSPGKSGSFFYYSRDYKYIIKTIHHAEHKYLRRILKDYYQHVTQNPNTLLSQFYGLHRVKMPYGKKIHFVVMNNLFPPHRDIHQTYDLKGSTVGRDYAEDNLIANPRGTLKDLNWMRRRRSIELGVTKKRLFLDQLQRDVALLKRLNIMDYSLLIGIHDLRKGNEENLRDKTLRVFNPGGERTSEEPDLTVLLRTPSKLENAKKARELRQMLRQERPVPMDQTGNRMPDELEAGASRPGFFNQDDGGFGATHEDNSPADEVYYLGVIDCLTHYGMVKKIEHFWKGLSHDKTQISALPPEQYGDRFYRFVKGVTMSAEEAKRKEQEREEAEAEAAQRLEEEGDEEEVEAGSCPFGSHHGRAHVPPMPTHQPPVPPVGRLPPNAEVENPDRNEEVDHLPVVDEAAESSAMNEKRPKTPAKDRPVTPRRVDSRDGTPKVGKPESADSGYGGNGMDGDVLRRKVSKASLDKSLPPLPHEAL